LISTLFAREYIAIVDFEGIDVSESEAHALTQRLTTEMIALEVYQVLERTEMKRLLEEQKFQYSGCVDMKCAIQIGKMIGAKYMVLGSISKLGTIYSIDARLINVETSESYISAKYDSSGEIDMLLKEGILSIAHQLSEIPIEQKLSKVNRKTNIETTPANGTLPLEIISEDYRYRELHAVFLNETINIDALLDENLYQSKPFQNLI